MLDGRLQEEDQLPRSQFVGSRSARSTFFDRAEHLELIGEHLDFLQADSRHLRVFEISGLGGVGKSRLLSEVRERTMSSRPRGLVCWVALEAEGYATEAGPLLAVRDQVDFDCLLFDAALVRFWHAIGQPFQISRAGRLSRSFVLRALDTGRAAAGIPVPLTFAVEVFHRATQKAVRLRRYQKSEFEEIDALRSDPRAIRARLPHYLALDIERRLAGKGRPFVGFYDAYDRQSPLAIADHARWLREFIGTLDRGVHLITARDPVGWSMDDWPSVLDRIALGTLPDAECRQLVRDRIGEVPADAEDRIIATSRHVPFFLEMAIDAYEMTPRTDGSVRLELLPRTPDGAVSHLLDHLPDGHRTLAVALAAVQTFDEGLYAHLVRTLNLPISVLDFDHFLEWFFVEELTESLYKVHDLMADFVYESESSASTCRAALASCLQYLGMLSLDSSPLGHAEVLLPLFRSVVVGWRRLGSSAGLDVQRLIDVGYVLYDQGYWHELAVIADEAGSDETLVAVTGFFRALSTRRTRGVAAGLALFEQLEPSALLFGSHEPSLRLEVAYLSELAGNYVKAREEFTALDRPDARLAIDDRTQLRVRLHHADVLTMDGEFVESSRLLLDAAEQVGTDSPLMWAEFVRQRAHDYRFSFAYVEAEALYLQALATSAGSGSLLGRLQTNLAETLCWLAPERAVEMAALAEELNARLGNQIELAKCGAAKAIAFARADEPLAAVETVRSARAGAGSGRLSRRGRVRDPGRGGRALLGRRRGRRAAVTFRAGRPRSLTRDLQPPPRPAGLARGR